MPDGLDLVHLIFYTILSIVPGDGKVIGQHVWGYADLEKRIQMENDTILPICSISKQFVCLTLAKIFEEDSAAAKADAALRDLLPATLADNKDLTVERLAAMQSGIRDYWALSVLWGAQVDQHFTLEKDAPAALQRLGKFHFEPGTSYSYSNVNFYVLGRIAEIITGQPLDDLLAEHVFKPAGMASAELAPNTNERPGPSVGYEGPEQSGFFQALNRIEWAGDAGIVASLNDMIAYEQYLDQQHTGPKSTYRLNAQEPTFIDGAPAFYGWGLAHDETAGHNSVGHGGALRGFRLNRRYIPDARLSVVVMFNHEADAGAAATYLLEKTLLKAEESDSVARGDAWEGAYFDPETQLATTVKHGDGKGELMVDGDKVKCTSPYEAKSRSVTATLSGDVVTIHRPRENQTITAHRIKPSSGVNYEPYVGSYRSDEIDSTFHVAGGPGMLYGSFDGYLGKGPAHLMKEIGEGVWYLSCQRSLDAQPPGNWTVVFEKGGDGAVESVTVGCWLARKVDYVKV
ncbi:hypothetical protein LTR09_008858 [Extremus antarcticus]|uniref:Beta-lactamase/transpeptidase-like protein n=1 Tax=Extremus antarcticus TaxID=702011 RepID=A0AAJ0DA48_9PEZI|nr:hypothetical protein LTR09_008858 [Extremus antarcticus]